jgi:hypothetical protein
MRSCCDLSPVTTFISVEAFTFCRFRTARIVLRSSPVSLVVFRNPRALISAIRLSLAVIRGEESNYPALIEVSSFLYDLNLLYEFSRVMNDPEYAGNELSSFSGFRNAKRVKPEDRLEVITLRIESPFELVTIVAIRKYPKSLG